VRFLEFKFGFDRKWPEMIENANLSSKMTGNVKFELRNAENDRFSKFELENAQFELENEE